MLRFNPWHVFFTLAFFALLSPLAKAVEELAALLLASYLFARITFIPFKRLFFTRAVAFDMGGVMTDGDFWTEEVREMPGMCSLVERLRVNYKVALITNNNALAFAPFDRKFGYSRLFDEVIVSGAVGAKKPDQKIYQITLRRLNVAPQNLYFVDDAPENIEAAKKLGIVGIVFKNQKQCEEALKAQGLRF